MQARQFRMGKLVLPLPPVSKNSTKQEILRNLDFPQLRFDYDRFIDAIDWYYIKYGISDELQNLILDCCNEVTAFMGAYPLDEANINTSMKKIVSEFELKMKKIEKKFIALSGYSELPIRLKRLIAYSFDGVTHFIWQFKFLINSYAVGENFPHAPTNWDRKQLFIQLVTEFQLKNKNEKFPVFKNVNKEMELRRFSFSRRTYTTWISEWKRGDIKKLIQN